eukprot:1160883-Pelagomonas_calceolata.AAC.8
METSISVPRYAWIGWLIQHTAPGHRTSGSGLRPVPRRQKYTKACNNTRTTPFAVAGNFKQSLLPQLPSLRGLGDPAQHHSFLGIEHCDRLM